MKTLFPETKNGRKLSARPQMKRGFRMRKPLDMYTHLLTILRKW